MRHLLVTALLAAAPLAAFAADEGGAFGELMVRKPVNAVCPFDGNPVDASLPPVGMVGADNQEVLVGADSQACLNRLHTTFGDEGHRVAAAAKANTTLAKLPAGAAPATPGAFGPKPATGPTATPAGPTAATAPGTFGAPAATAPGTFGAPAATAPGPAVVTPAPVGAATTGKTDKKTEKKAEKSEKHEEPLSNVRGDQSDERQRQKKAAQRRDRGESEDGETKHKSSSKKKSKSETDDATTTDAGTLGTGAVGQ